MVQILLQTMKITHLAVILACIVQESEVCGNWDSFLREKPLSIQMVWSCRQNGRERMIKGMLYRSKVKGERLKED